MSKSMTKSRALALQLTEDFFNNGCFETFGGGGAPAISPAATSGNQFYNFDDFQSGYAGLSVQCVGCDETPEQERVYIYVTKGGKKQLETISNDKGGVFVKVINIGKTVIKPEVALSATNRGHVFVRDSRIACGSSCQPSGENYSGTIGAIVQRNGELFALSNNHVFAACNHVQIGQPIISPSNADCGPNIPAPRMVARHSGIIELRSGNPKLVPTTSLDVAFAAIEHNAITSWQGNEENGYDTPTTGISPSVGMSVKKFGRTTGLTFGTIESYLPASFWLPYQCKKFAATVWFQDIWMVKAADKSEHFALNGDSGSLVVTEDGKNAVGLLFAVNSHGKQAFIMSIETILKQLEMTLVNGHGI